MMELVRDFVRRIFVYLLVDTMVSQLTSHTKFYPYIRFFMGLFLVLMLVSPIFSILQQSENFSLNCIFEWNQLEKKERGMEREMELFMDSTQRVWERQYTDSMEEIVRGWAEDFSMEIGEIELILDDDSEMTGIRIECSGDKNKRKQFSALLQKRLQLKKKDIKIIQ